MIEVKEELLDNNLIKHYAIDENGKKYKIMQVETNVVYDEAIDVLPCRYTYKATDKVIEEVINLISYKEKQQLEEAYKNYIVNGGTLSKEEWLTQQMKKQENV